VTLKYLPLKMEITITELLDGYKFPRSNMSKWGPKVNISGVLSLYGSYCMDKRIKFKDIQNKHNRNLHFISEGMGRTVRVVTCTF